MEQKILVLLLGVILLFGCTSTGNTGNKAAVTKTSSPETKIISKTSPSPGGNSLPSNSQSLTPTPAAQLNEFQLQAQQTQTETNAITSDIADADAVINDIDALVSLEGFA